MNDKTTSENQISSLYPTERYMINHSRRVLSLHLLTPHTFEIKEPLFTEPLLYLSSGEPGGLYQSVDLSHDKMQHKMKHLAWVFINDSSVLKKKKNKKISQ